MSTDRYFIARLTGQEGPLSVEQVRVGLRNGRYSGKEMSWSEAQAGEWLALNERPEFNNAPLTDAELDELPAFKPEPRPAPEAPPEPLEIDLASLRRKAPQDLTTDQIELVKRAGIAWRRFLARHVDLLVCGMLFLLVWQPKSPEAVVAAGALPALLIYALCPWLEATFLVLFGNTPGKSLLRLQLVRTDGARPGFLQVLKRGLHVWVWGMGLGVRWVSLVTCALSFNQFTRNGRSHWDVVAGTAIVAAPISHVRMGTIVGLFVAFAALAALSALDVARG